jgi:hypothetical protein
LTPTAAPADNSAQELRASFEKRLPSRINAANQVIHDPWTLRGRLFDLMQYSTSMTMRLCRQAFGVAIIFLASPSAAAPSYGGRLLAHLQDDLDRRPLILVSDEGQPQEPDMDVFALMSGKCSTLKVAGSDFACKGVAFFHGGQGRTNFTVALDDPADDSHVISFSGENGRKDENDRYELPIDRMLLSSKDRPKADGLPVPFVELSAGICKQIGNFATGQISSIACSATDKKGKKYELKFESDGSPMTVRRLRRYSLNAEKRRVRQNEQLECRRRADAEKILPRDWTPFLIRCLAENGERVAPTAE